MTLTIGCLLDPRKDFDSLSLFNIEQHVSFRINPWKGKIDAGNVNIRTMSLKIHNDSYPSNQRSHTPQINNEFSFLKYPALRFKSLHLVRKYIIQALQKGKLFCCNKQHQGDYLIPDAKLKNGYRLP